MHNCIRITPLIQQLLHDWILLATEANAHPFPMHTVVPRAPHILGATDASKLGMGGCWTTTDNTGHTTNYLWRTPFPAHVQQQFVTTENPLGHITNSDLELAAITTGSVLMAQQGHTPHAHLYLASDNTPAVSWITMGSTTSTGPAAYLLHLLAQQRRTIPYTLSALYTPGETNTIADCCSHLSTLPDDQFLDTMNKYHPVQPSWTLVQPTPKLASSVISALLKQLQPLASRPPDAALATQSGTSGSPSALTYTSTPTYKPSMMPSHCSKSLRTTAEVIPWLPAGLKYVQERWKAPFALLDRRLPHWAAQILAYDPQENSTSDYHANSAPTKRKTHHQPGSSQSLSP
jgi:hypothetical protein